MTENSERFVGRGYRHYFKMSQLGEHLAASRNPVENYRGG